MAINSDYYVIQDVVAQHRSMRRRKRTTSTQNLRGRRLLHAELVMYRRDL